MASDETSGKVAAGEVALERVEDVAGQRSGIGHLGMGGEGREVRADEAMEGGFLGAAGTILGCGRLDRRARPAPWSSVPGSGSVPRRPLALCMVKPAGLR